MAFGRQRRRAKGRRETPVFRRGLRAIDRLKTAEVHAFMRSTAWNVTDRSEKPPGRWPSIPRQFVDPATVGSRR